MRRQLLGACFYALCACDDAGPAVGPTVTLMPATPRVTAAEVPTLAPQPGVRAFPGAEGFGAAATGGRGGRVIYVTTLAARGPGSLVEALEASGPRYVLFKVSGLIDASPFIGHGDLTVAAQTSPGGVIVRGLATGESPGCDSDCGAGVRGVDNVIIRHLRSRPGDPAGNGHIDGDGLRLRHARNVMIDHLSVGNAVDEAIEISYANHITVQDTILAETIGDHAVRGGMLMNYSNPAAGYELDAITVLRSAWVRIQGRYPEMARESDAALNATMHVELANNLLWDQRYYIETGHNAGTPARAIGPVFFQMNWVGNLGVVRPTYRFGMLFFSNPTGMSTVYFRDNHLTSRPDRVDWELVYCCNDFLDAPTPRRPAWARDARHDFPPIAYIAADDVRRYVLAHAGAFPRDPMDRRLMGYVADGVAVGDGLGVNPAGDIHRFDFTAASAPAAPVDTDADGMPDAWETANGLDPATDDHNGLAVGQSRGGVYAGYPNLEVYLDELAEQRLTARAP